MAISDENMVMPVSPMNNGGFGGFGNGDGWWIILLFLVFGMNGFGGYGNGGNVGGAIYPWMNQSNQINDGFRDQMLNTSINGIQSGVQNISTQLCNGFANAEVLIDTQRKEYAYSDIRAVKLEYSQRVNERKPFAIIHLQGCWE